MLKNNTVEKFIIVFSIAQSFFCCTNDLPTRQDFKDWISVVYQYDNGLKADEISIDNWERTPKEVRDQFPGLDGFDVEAMIFTFPKRDKNMSEEEFLRKTTIHYVICHYLKFNDKWSLHASSWGGGYWKEDTKEWRYLFEECKYQVSKFRTEYLNELKKRK